jgi:hypothetical protein
MTDRTLSISDALREAQLQRLEASLACRAASKPQATTHQEPRPASRRRNTQFEKSSTPLCLFEVSCPLWRSESLSSQHQDSMSPRESEATQAERPGLVFDSPHGSARFRSGIPRTTPCSSTGTVLSAFCAPLDGPFWTPKDNVLFPSTEIGSMDPMRSAGI